MFAYHLVPCPAAYQFVQQWLDESLTDGHCQTLLAKCRAIVEQGASRPSSQGTVRACER